MHLLAGHMIAGGGEEKHYRRADHQLFPHPSHHPVFHYRLRSWVPGLTHLEVEVTLDRNGRSHLGIYVVVHNM